MTIETNITFVLAPSATSDIDQDLVNLTEYLTNKVFKGEHQGGGLLGGKFGYGVDFENDTFMMHQYCCCEQSDCKWCECDAPNFKHKSSGFEVRWYKWIGRSSENNKNLNDKEWKAIYKDCIKSINF